jgi:hypothetical protein
VVDQGDSQTWHCTAFTDIKLATLFLGLGTDSFGSCMHSFSTVYFPLNSRLIF